MKQHVALTRCFFCGGDKDILLATRWRNGEPARDMSQYHGMAVDKEPCPKCAEHMRLGVILISVKDGESGDNPYRTGGFWVVKDEAIRRMVRSPELAETIIHKRVCFVPDSACKAMCLPEPNETH